MGQDQRNSLAIPHLDTEQCSLYSQCHGHSYNRLYSVYILKPVLLGNGEILEKKQEILLGCGSLYHYFTLLYFKIISDHRVTCHLAADQYSWRRRVLWYYCGYYMYVLSTLTALHELLDY